MNPLNKMAHGIVLAFFGVACWFVWALLQLPLMVRMHGVALQLPAFTRLCMALGPGIVISLAAIATGYCFWVWFRKAESGRSWVGFLATATSSLFLVTLPVVVAIYLPLVNALQSLPAK
jgi:membrane protease YdiL (CAAX protease family)